MGVKGLWVQPEVEGKAYFLGCLPSCKKEGRGRSPLQNPGCMVNQRETISLLPRPLFPQISMHIRWTDNLQNSCIAKLALGFQAPVGHPGPDPPKARTQAQVPGRASSALAGALELCQPMLSILPSLSRPTYLPPRRSRGLQARRAARSGAPGVRALARFLPSTSCKMTLRQRRWRKPRPWAPPLLAWRSGPGAELHCGNGVAAFREWARRSTWRATPRPRAGRRREAGLSCGVPVRVQPVWAPGTEPGALQVWALVMMPRPDPLLLLALPPKVWQSGLSVTVLTLGLHQFTPVHRARPSIYSCFMLLRSKDLPPSNLDVSPTLTTQGLSVGKSLSIL